MHVAICGAGVIGASIAYFLAIRGVCVTLIERGDVACAASGKSGGFLARDWCDGSALGPLAQRSFELHGQLASAFAKDGKEYGYRRVNTLMVHDDSHSQPATNHWLNGSGRIGGLLGDESSTAQVSPEPFTRALVDAACTRGAQLIRGEVEGLATRHGDDGTVERVSGVSIGGNILQADVVVIAMGPWTTGLSEALGLPPVHGLRGNSLILKPQAQLPAECLFIETHDPSAGNISPEIYPRADGCVYVCGMADDLPIPMDPLAIEANEAACDVLFSVGARLSSHLADAKVVKKQACFRPIVADGLPLLGPVTALDGVYVATGHNCWGILNAPASGEALAELISTGASQHVDLQPFHPARF
ncbi:MAG: NAD(P)/FAD-dependent oxidoreductase [Gammaproteobacteria bacterium]